jgi:adenosine deaminase
MDIQTLRQIPKIDLHVHIDGSVRPATILDLARKRNFPLPADTADALERHVTAGHDCCTLGDFLRIFDTFYPILKSPEAVERIAYELCELEARDGVIYVEARFAPVLQAGDGEPLRETVEAALRGLHRGAEAFGIRTGLILCCYRSEPPASSVETVETAAALLGKGVVGVDLAGDEENHPAVDHLPAFVLARQKGIPVTVHAGEVCGPKNIQEAVFLLGARRLGHAVHLAEDPELLDHVVQSRIPIETCLTSNRQTGAWTDTASHPLAGFLAAGACVALGTDDPAVSRTTLSAELDLAARSFDLGPAEIRRLCLNAAEAAFQPPEVREEFTERIRRAFHESQ